MARSPPPYMGGAGVNAPILLVQCFPNVYSIPILVILENHAGSVLWKHCKRLPVGLSLEQIFVMHSDVEQFTSLALIFAIRATNVCGGARVQTFTSRCIQSAAPRRNYILWKWMLNRSQRSLHSYSATVMRACVRRGGAARAGEHHAACLSKTIRPRLVP